MASVIASLSRQTSLASISHHSSTYVSPSPVGSNASAPSLSKASLNIDDDENVTITANRTLFSRSKGKRKSQDDLHYLAISTHITELSYSISDIQTRIFEIQELRHKSQSSGDAGGTTGTIDQALMNLDERLETVTKGMKAVNDSVEPLLSTGSAPPVSNNDSGERVLLLRKHATLVAEWESVQDESEVLREELKEDKWLTVFRTVTEQADGMMSSLEKAVNRCQDFIWQVHRRGPDETQSLSSLSSHQAEKSPLTIEVFNSLLESFEAKKKHYMPATSKVLSIIDKGVQDRVTKNGETLRRHAESAKRWRTLKDRIARTDSEMEGVRKIFLGNDAAPSENGSSTSAVTSSTKNGFLATPPNMSRTSSRAPSSTSTISRSISPFRKFARKITGRSPAHLATPLPPMKAVSHNPASDPVTTKVRQRQSFFSFRNSQPPLPPTPERPGHKYSQSLTPESSPSARRLEGDSTVKGRPGPPKEKWNSSTKVVSDNRNTPVKQTVSRRSSAMGLHVQYEDIPPVPPIGDPYIRSLSRSSISSRPRSSVTSSVSTAPTSNPSIAVSAPHTMSRPFTPCRPITPSRSYTPGLGATPRSRPKTPSHIPGPAMHLRSFSARQSDLGWDEEENETTMLQRAITPSMSLDRSQTPSGTRIPPPRPPSRSKIPLPSLSVSSVSRPSSAMSDYGRPESRMSSSVRASLGRAQTPESTLRAKTQLIPFYQGSGVSPRPAPRSTPQGKLPPSSFRDSSAGRTPGSSRPSSRAGAYTPTPDNPVHQYVSTNPKDPLDQEIAAIVNSIAHGLLVERVDPPLKTAPRPGEEIRAQYAFSNALSRKVVTCRLTTLTRSGAKNHGQPTTTKKVMCRVGGGWQDLHIYMLNRQAGL